MAEYWVTGYLLSDFLGPLADNTSETVGKSMVGTSVTLSAAADPVTFVIDDDDGQFQDAYQETGSLSTLADDLTIGGVTYPASASNIECEFKMVAAGDPPINFYIGRIGTGTSNSGENVFVFTDQPLEPGATYDFTGFGDGQDIPYNAICFAAGTLIDTPQGPVRVEDLCPGDRVITRDAGIQPILWTGQRRLSAADLTRAPHLAPIRIAAGALGDGTPSSDLLLSPQHRVAIDDWRAQHFFGEEAILAPARGLCNDRNVTIDRPMAGILYCHILLETHELVRANGQWAETLLLGPQARAALGDEQLIEIEEIFPGLTDGAPSASAPILTVAESAVLTC